MNMKICMGFGQITSQIVTKLEIQAKCRLDTLMSLATTSLTVMFNSLVMRLAGKSKIIENLLTTCIPLNPLCSCVSPISMTRLKIFTRNLSTNSSKFRLVVSKLKKTTLNWITENSEMCFPAMNFLDTLVTTVAFIRSQVTQTL